MEELKEYQKELDNVIEIFSKEIYKLQARVQEMSDKIEGSKENENKVEQLGRVEKGKEYWFITNDIDFPVDKDIEGDFPEDSYIYEIGNYFKTEEEAEKALEKIKIYNKLKRFAEENNVDRIDWEKDHVHKWCICYDYDLNEIVVRNTLDLMGIGEIYFTNEEIAEQAIEEIGEKEIKRLFI